MVNIKKIARDNDLNIDELIKFLLDNNWFNCTKTAKNNEVFLVCDNDDEIISKILDHFDNKDLPDDVKLENVLVKLGKEFPKTEERFRRFISENKIDNQSAYYVANFYLHNAVSELHQTNNIELLDLIKEACVAMNKGNGIILCKFAKWLRIRAKTLYTNDYELEKRYSVDTSPLREDEYLKLIYTFTDEQSIEDNQMFQKAVESKEYADHWLFIILFFICSIRTPDKLRFYHPILPRKPETILQEIKNEIFTDEDARAIAYAIEYELTVFPLLPNKTKKYSGISDVFFSVPETCKVLLGKLLAICESHFQVNKCEGFLIRDGITISSIKKYMGQNFYEAFPEGRFSILSLTKSYLQSLEKMGNAINSNDGITNFGHLCSSISRSHKMKYGEYSPTTSIYLANQEPIERIAYGLYQRGPLSFVVSEMLDMLTDGNYKGLDFDDQTEIIKLVNLTPYEVNTAVEVIKNKLQNSSKVLNELCTDKLEVANALNNIAFGNYSSKTCGSPCLLSYFDRICPFSEKNCFGCDYEVETYTTLFMAASEYRRLLAEYKETRDDPIKARNKYLALKVLMPKIKKMIDYIQKVYGQEAVTAFEKMLEAEYGKF